jgi:hypothetical protein
MHLLDENNQRQKFYLEGQNKKYTFRSFEDTYLWITGEYLCHIWNEGELEGCIPDSCNVWFYSTVK